jgi:hypothetical protein
MSADQLSSPYQRLVWYYRSGEVAVTSRFLHVGGERFAIADLSDLMRARGPAHPGVTIGTAIAIVQAPIIVPLVGLVRAPLVWVAALVVLVVPIVVAFVCARLWPPRQELLARYRGADVTLFSSRNEQQFGQIARAVSRAVSRVRDR